MVSTSVEVRYALVEIINPITAKTRNNPNGNIKFASNIFWNSLKLGKAEACNSDMIPIPDIPQIPVSNSPIP